MDVVMSHSVPVVAALYQILWDRPGSALGPVLGFTAELSIFETVVSPHLLIPCLSAFPC